MTIKELDGKHLTIDEALEQYEKLIHKTAQRLKGIGYKQGLELEDITQVVRLTFLKIFEKHNPEKLTFVTYAYHHLYIMSMREIKKYNSGAYVPVYIKDLEHAIKRDGLEGATIAEAQKHYPDFSKKEIGFAYSYLQDKKLLTFSDYQGEGEGDKGYFDKSVGKDGDYTAIFVRDFMSRLDKTDLDIVRSRLKDERTEDVAQRLGVYAQSVNRRIRRIRRKWNDYKEGAEI
ncbi:sigma-70 family RNA polymerase sigma factor [Salicibibacter halophilus]|uniref:Sigma-70 family RNA polymerase sigma factor n=1 Tax=Salicibibacter halophilus TaxID=2502791 RepID=A0A514LFA0_9BACI|nr:sigma-70 family RNA polymerase sigma factor [Salicibibacter halophilus]QDI90235.1 sigma-70 family RNA polymerase sigma factor [Salicibibacter halophilus]